MRPNERCSKCGAWLLAKTPGGQCPRCLLGVAFDDEEISSEVPPVRRERFGDYELDSLIGSGGMGRVYRARQVSLNRWVALKLIHAGRFAGLEEVARFRRGAEVAAALDHPQIAHIYEAGKHEDQYYFTMKFVEGQTLAEWNRGCPSRDISWCRRVVKVVASVARALHHAHQRGVMHRDLKPANIILNRAGEPFIVDFGLAQVLDRTLVRRSEAVGTLEYMAPEQLLGSAKDITTEVDIYGLGVILYELLTGRLPRHAASIEELKRNLMEQEVTSPRAINPLVDADLASICLKCLQLRPDLRYVAASALVEDLEHWLGGEPVSARAMRPAERARKWAIRHPFKAATTCVLFLGLALGIGFALHHYFQSPAAPVARPLVASDLDGTFALDLRADEPPRCTDNFDARKLFAGAGRRVRLTFENVPLDLLPELRAQILADAPGRDAPARSPVLENGQSFHLQVASPRDQAFYAVAVGFSVSNLLAAAPDARIVLSPAEAADPAVVSIGRVPRITSFDPPAAGLGDLVTLTGQDFSPVPGSNLVRFVGGLRSAVLAAEPTRLTVKVPPGIRHGPITVTVAGLTAYSPKSFLPTFKPAGEFGTNAFEPRLTLGVPLRAGLPLLDDLDSDGKPDLAVFSGDLERAVCLFRNVGSPGSLTTNSFAPRFDLFENGQFASSLGAAADLTGNGRLDLVLPSYTGIVRLAQNITRPGSLDSGSFLLPTPLFAIGCRAVVRDLDGDGRPDFGLHGSPSQVLLIYQNAHSRWPLRPSSFRLALTISSGLAANVQFEDLDGDGKPEIISALADKLNVRQNLSSPGQLGPESFSGLLQFPGPPNQLSVLVGDLDGDGKPEVVTASNTAEVLSVFRNQAAPGPMDTNSLAPRVDFPCGNSAYHMALGDLNGDGKPDLVIPIEFNHEVEVRLNRSVPGHIDFAPVIRIPTDPRPLTAAIGDIDGDGCPDLATANYLGTVSLLRNTSATLPRAEQK